MKRSISGKLIALIMTILLVQTGRAQLLADTLEYSFHKHFAPVFKEKKVKRIYYSLELPFLMSASYDLKTKKYESTWVEDTFLVSHNYATNGYPISEIRTLLDGALNKKTEYFFNNAGTLTKMIFTDSSKLRDFEFQEQLFEYENDRLRRIRKTTIIKGDTINSVLSFYYSHGNLVQAIEMSDKDQLLESSLFLHDSNDRFIKEINVQNHYSGVKVTSTYYYSYDEKKRISGVYGGLGYLRRKKKPLKVFTYDFVKEAYIFETWSKKIDFYK